MSIFAKIFGGHKSGAPTEAPACPHKALVPRWDKLEDIGKEDLVVGYRCSGCGQSFSREEALLYLGRR